MINRRQVIERNNPVYRKLNKDAPLSVGNGKFCFTADFTGLQTFFDEYAAADDAFPLCTMADWGWHSYTPVEDESELRLTPFDTYGRTVNYATDSTGQEELFKNIRVNAHKFHLGKVSFEYLGNDLSITECEPVCQILNLWEGVLSSVFKVNNEIVSTETFIHPEEDTLYFRAASSFLKSEKLRITITFPYGSHKKSAADFLQRDLHTTKLCEQYENGICVERKLDTATYKVAIKGKGFTPSVDGHNHKIILTPQEEEIKISISFITEKTSLSASYEDALAECKRFWENYWNSGAVIDFSGSTDARAMELERRTVLSHYLIAIQSRGKYPPAETGLTCNSWYGKFHLEMHYWHHAQFALWGRVEELKNALEYYKQILPVAKEIAKSQGYTGARWPKMCDPSGKNTPSSVAVLLIWQQPHPIMMAELIWRAEQNHELLREYREIIVETAEFIKSFIHKDGDKYVVGPPYIPAQERHDPKIVLNAPYELEYFRWGLRKADEWLARLGEPACYAVRYAQFAENLTLPAVKDGVYLAHENCPDTFSKLPFYTDHPSMLAMFGVLDSGRIDTSIMSATLDKVLEVWDKKTFYGWDFPMMAMTACRLGRYKDAVDLLLMESPKNTWMENGHNRMTGDDALPLYLPGNGGFLIAMAMMAAGYGDVKGSSFPEGFNVTAEGILPYI